MTLHQSVRRVLVASGIALFVATASPGVGSAGTASVVAPVAVANVSPAAGDVVGVAAPVTVTFTGPVRDRAGAEAGLRFAAGAPAGASVWLADDVLQWTPTGMWPAHSTIALSVGDYKTSFETGAAVVGVADLDAFTFTVSIDGVVARKMPASMGKRKFPTPIGSFTALEKQRNVTFDSRTIGIPLSSSEGYLIKGEYGVRVTWGGVYVHSAPWSVGAQGNSNVSHGCINLSPDNAAWYFDTVGIGDPIIVQA